MHSELDVPFAMPLTGVWTTTKHTELVGFSHVRGAGPMRKLFAKYPVITVIVIWAALILAMWLVPSDPHLSHL